MSNKSKKQNYTSISTNKITTKPNKNGENSIKLKANKITLGGNVNEFKRVYARIY